MIKKLLITLLSCMILFAGCNGESSTTSENPEANIIEENTENSKEDATEEKEVPNLSSFTTTALTGEEVTQDIFSKYDITMVNIWATWCGPCVGEIPELQKVYENLPENANLVTICTDLETEGDAAKEILDASGAKFLALQPTDEMEDSLLKMVTGIPTTVFIDKEGKMVGNAIVGVPGKDPAQAYLNKINEILASMA